MTYDLSGTLLDGAPIVDRFLRDVSYGNAVFSGASGLILLTAAQPLGSWMGVDLPWGLRGLGAGLLSYAAVVAWVARTGENASPLRWWFVLLDFGWVAGSLALLSGNGWIPSEEGRWLIAAVALVVMGLAAAQLFALGHLSARGRDAT